MSNNFEKTWELYVQAWKAVDTTQKMKLFEQCLHEQCQYHDPLIKTRDWDELLGYMLEFHQQIPGGHFVTKNFHSHTNKCLAVWDMQNGNNVRIGDGFSYGEYDSNGKLTAMTGFFHPPQ